MPLPDPPHRPAVRPFSHTLNRLQAHEGPSPDQNAEQARSLLLQRFGASDAPVAIGRAPIPHPLLADHVRHAPGLALILMRSRGVAVALRTAAHTSIAFDASLTDAEQPVLDDVLQHMRTVLAAASVTAEVAVVHTHIPKTLAYEGQGMLAALHTALRTETADATPLPNHVQNVQPPLALALAKGTLRDVVLIDTERGDAIVVPPPADASAARWALLTTATAHPNVRQTTVRAKRLLNTLHDASAFSELSSLRALEHRDLAAALDAVPRAQQGPLRYWVTEGSRVQKMTVALRKGDWQMAGALLLMADASRRNDANAHDAAATALIERLETMARPELYGALTAGPGQVLVLGHAYELPRVLEHLQRGAPNLQAALL